MSDLNDFLKVIAEAKANDPKHQRIKEVKEHVKSDLGSLFDQLGAVKASDPREKLIKEVKEHVASDIAALFSSLEASAVEAKVTAEPIQIEDQLEKIDELVEAVEQIEEELLIEVTPIEEPKTPEERQQGVEKYLSALPKDSHSFQQPLPQITEKDLKAITDKLKFLEQWVGKVSAAGPGGGEVNLRWLDDVDRATIGDGKYLNYNATTKKFQFSTLSGGGAPQVQSDWDQADNAELSYIKNKPTLFSGSYDDLTDTPTIPDAQVNSDWNATTGVEEILNKPTIPDAQIQSDWNQSNDTELDYIKNKPTIPDITDIEDALAVSGEPMGHEDATQSTLSFNAATRTFTIAPVVDNFDVWVKGSKYTYTTAQTITIPNISGIYYIYFDSNGLGAQTDYFIWDQQAPTALVYYNAVTGLAPYFADERHGTTLDWQTHEYLHRTRGAVIANGFAIGNYTIGGAVQLDIANGTFFDEDLEIDVVHSNTPTPNTWEQDLQGPAQIPMFYLSGTGWVRDNPTGYLNKQGTSRPRYNSLSGGVWSVADIDNNKYGTTFIVATNNLTYPIIGIMSQSSHANQGDAEGLEFSDLALTGFPVAEFRLLYKVVFKANSTHGTLTSVWDLRQLSATTPSAAIGSDHGLLSGLGDDDHPQYLLRTEYSATADANSLTGTTLKSTVVNSSLTSVGTLTDLTISGGAAVTANAATSHFLNIGTHGQLFDDDNFHIHSISGPLWINTIDGSDINIGKQKNAGVSNVQVGGNFSAGGYIAGEVVNSNSTIYANTNITANNNLGVGVDATVGRNLIVTGNVTSTKTTPDHSFFPKVHTTYNTTEPYRAMDNLNVRLRWTGSSNLILEGSAVSGSFTAYVTHIENIAGEAPRMSTNAAGITFTSGTWSSLGAYFQLRSGGDTTIAHITDTTNGRIYRVTFIHLVRAIDGYISIERMC